MTADNSTPITGITGEDGQPLTRGQVVEMIAVDLRAIRDGVTHAVTAYEEDGDSNPVVLASLALANHLAGYTARINALVANHDREQAALDLACASVTIPDSLPEDFA